MSISINSRALLIVNEMIEKQKELGIIVKKTSEGTTIIDAGIETYGGYLAGKYVTDICMGGLGRSSLTSARYGDLHFPGIFVSTNKPSIALFGAQMAGWVIKIGKYYAMGSGPARALSLKPKELYTKIGYKDEADVAVLVLETTEEPNTEIIKYIANACKVNPENLYLLLTPTSSVAGSTQISGRIVETGFHKFTEVGFDPQRVIYGSGFAPIAPSHPKFAKAMGRTNDALIFAGQVFLTVISKEDENLEDFIVNTPSCSSTSYGKPFYEVIKEVDFDFYKIDPSLFAPAVIIVNDLRTGKTYKAGKINLKLLKKSFNLREFK